MGELGKHGHKPELQKMRITWKKQDIRSIKLKRLKEHHAAVLITTAEWS